MQKLICVLISSCLAVITTASTAEISDLLDVDLQNFTSKALSVDEWLFSEDLFPGHDIPQNIGHRDAIKLFTKLVDDHEILEEAYRLYRIQHNKDAEDDVKYNDRKHHFKSNLHFIFQHNLQHDSGEFGFQVGVNMFADMSREEMKNFLGANDRIPVHPKNFNMSTDPYGPGPMPPPQPLSGNGAPTEMSSSSSFPPFFDFGDKKMITPVKNQKQCGSCVHFAHGGMMETLYALANDGEMINVSEQMFLDCAVPEHGYTNNAGCNGNIMEDSGQFIVDHGVTLEEHYKYRAKQGVCDKDGKIIVAKLKDYYRVKPSIESFKHTLVYEHKPIAAAFLVHPPFMFYRSGIYDWCTPPGGFIGGHAVLVVGYGHFFDQGYWRVKNSWGVKWGEAGFFKYIAGSTFCRFEKWGFTGTLER